jgi:multiple antibiotic resistance protein
MENSFSIVSTAILLNFILDPFGNVPLILSILKDVDEKRRFRIIVRELLIGLFILLAFLFFGSDFLDLFHLETTAVSLAGAVIFFIIGMKMIFPPAQGNSLYAGTGEPFVVPIAMPMIAGPSALATLLVLSNQNPGHTLDLFWSLLLAWLMSAIILLLAPFLYRILRDRGLIALERLMGMLLLILSVQMFIDGFRALFSSIE